MLDGLRTLLPHKLNGSPQHHSFAVRAGFGLGGRHIDRNSRGLVVTDKPTDNPYAILGEECGVIEVGVGDGTLSDRFSYGMI